MTSSSISLKNNLLTRWNAIAPAWRWAVGVFVIARVFYTLWSLVILLLVPSVLQNLDLFGTPIVATFDVATSQRAVYSRVVKGHTLSFQKLDAARMTDTQTGSVWSIADGQAISGLYAGTSSAKPIYTAEDVFPYHGVEPPSNPLLAIWQRFDTSWYLAIAARGYSDAGSTVYFPLYPLLIRSLSVLLLDRPLLAALSISNLAFVVVLYLLYRIAEDLFGNDAAKRALIYLAIFPTAFFFLAGYTESLFLLFAMAALYFARKELWVWASICGALAALTRLQGILLIIPLLYLLFARSANFKSQTLRQKLGIGLPLVLIPLATVGFLLWNELSLLSAYEGELHARFILPWENFFAAVLLFVQGNAGSADLTNLAATILFGVMCIIVWLKMPREFGLYAIVMFVAPLFRMTTTQPLVSMARYVVVLFPVFMLWSFWGKNAWVNRAIFYPSILLGLYLCAQFFLWGWVA